jgi:O-succinylbenzoic acid--CoA ligase
MPTLRRLSDDDPAALTAALEHVWAAGDAAVVLPPDAPAASLPTAVDAALRGDVVTPDGTALVVPTSGSTGAPRAIVLPHGALAAAVATGQARLGCTPGERWTLALPTRHVAGLMVLLRARALGTAPVVIDPGDPVALAAAAGTAQHVAVVPTQLARALDGGHDLSGFRTVLVGGGPAGGDLLERARAAGVRIVTSYGMTETCGGVVYDGVPLDGTEVGLRADGRIRLRGPSLAACELDGAPLTDRDGWFTTSDLGLIADGRLEIVGRADDVILSGGVNVDPIAVEAALRAHPAVVDAVVVGVPDPMWGRAVRAVIVPRAPVGLAELRAHVSARLGPAHAPRELLRVEAVPRDGLGKLAASDRVRLRTSAADETHPSGI